MINWKTCKSKQINILKATQTKKTNDINDKFLSLKIRMTIKNGILTNKYEVSNFTLSNQKKKEDSSNINEPII
jgi:hypothetical protein